MEEIRGWSKGLPQTARCYTLYPPSVVSGMEVTNVTNVTGVTGETSETGMRDERDERDECDGEGK